MVARCCVWTGAHMFALFESTVLDVRACGQSGTVLSCLCPPWISSLICLMSRGKSRALSVLRTICNAPACCRKLACLYTGSGR